MFDVNDRKKIAFVAGSNLPVPAIKGGAIETLLTAFIEQNEKHPVYDITVFCGYDAEAIEYSNKYNNCRIVGIRNTSIFRRLWIAFYRLIRKISPKELAFKTYYMQSVNDYLKKEYYDCIICESTYVDAAQIKKTNGQRVIYHVHSDYLKPSTPCIREIYNKVDLFLGVSDFISNKLLDISNTIDYGKTMVHTLNNAIEVEYYQVNSEERNKIRENTRKELGIGNEKVIIYCSRLSPEKGCSELIEAISDIDGVTLIIVGGNSFSSNKQTEYVVSLKNKAKSSKARIIFTGYVAHKDIRKYLFAADIAVVPSVCNEAASLTLLEFRASGLITIASKVGGIPEYAAVNTYQIPFDGRFVDNLTNGIRKALADLEGFTAYDNSVEKFSYERYFENFCSEIRNLCEYD